MARNRKYRSMGARFGPALKAFILCLLLGGTGVGYVWQKNQLYDLGIQKGQRETKLGNLEIENERLRKQLASMRGPKYLEARIRDLKLGLAPPLPSQIWRLTEPAREVPRPGHEGQSPSRESQVATMP